MKRAEKVRLEACHLAVQHMANEPGDAGDMLAWCTFFTAFIEHGPEWCEKHMKLMARKIGPELTVVS